MITALFVHLCVNAVVFAQEAPPGGFSVAETPPPPPPPRVSSYALFVGVNVPAGLSGDLQPLQHAETDAERMAGSPFSFGYEQVVILTGPQATTARVNAELDRALAELSDEARVLVYFASHGGMALPKEGGVPQRYLLLADGDAARLAETGLHVHNLHQKLVGKASDAEIIEIYDACATLDPGQDGRDRGRSTRQRSVPELVPDDGAQPRVQLFAAKDGAGTRESDPLESGEFTYYLMEAVRGAGDQDGDRNGVVTLGEAFAYASAHMGGGARPLTHSEEQSFGASAQVPLAQLQAPLLVPRTVSPPADCEGCVYNVELSPLGEDAAPLPPGPIDRGLYRLSVTLTSDGGTEVKQLGPPLRGLTFVGPWEVLDPLAKEDISWAYRARPLWVEAGVMVDLDDDPEEFSGFRPPIMPTLGVTWIGRGSLAPVVGLQASAGPNSWATQKVNTETGKPMAYSGIDMTAQARFGAQVQRKRLGIGAQLVVADTAHWYIVPQSASSALFEKGLFGPDFNPGLGTGARAQLISQAWTLSVEQTFLWEWTSLSGELLDLSPLGVSAITVITVGRRADVL